MSPVYLCNFVWLIITDLTNVSSTDRQKHAQSFVSEQSSKYECFQIFREQFYNPTLTWEVGLEGSGVPDQFGLQWELKLPEMLSPKDENKNKMKRTHEVD